MNALHTAPVKPHNSNRSIGKYPVLRKLGDGGMSSVYLARHPLLDRQLIIKQLKNVSGEQAVKRFEREARIMLDLRHENIVQVYDYFHERGASYIVMEYVDGVSLDKLLEPGTPLDETAVLLLIRETARALCYAHRRGIVHRDIKPGNILISKEGAVKLTDFGIATSSREAEAGLTVSGMTLGTPAYMSPEQLSSSHTVDRRADSYSLGITLYEAACGKQPFPAQFCPETISAIQQGHYIRPRKVNPALSRRTARLIRRLIHRKPQRRFADLHKLVRKLDRLGRTESSAELLRLTFFHNNDDNNINYCDNICVKNREDNNKKCSNKDKTPAERAAQNNPGAAVKPEHPAADSHSKAHPVHLSDPALPVTPPRSRFKKHLAAIGILTAVTATTLLAVKLHNDRLLQMEQSGRLQVSVTASGRLFGKHAGQLFLDGRLQRLSVKSKPENHPVKLRLVSAPDSHEYRFASKLLRLPAGNYRLQLNLENQLREYRFFLAPELLQQHHPERAGGRLIKVRLHPPARRPLHLSSRISAQHSGADLTGKAAIEVWQNGWQEWDKLQQQKQAQKTLTSGRWYKFRISAAGYYPAFTTLYAKHFQQQLHLTAELIPRPAYLRISADRPLQLRINNSQRWLEGGPRPELRRLPQVSGKAVVLTMLPGEHFVTLQHGELQHTLKVTLDSGDWLLLQTTVNRPGKTVRVKKRLLNR